MSAAQGAYESQIYSNLIYYCSLHFLYEKFR